MALVVTIAGVVRTSVTVQGSVYVEQRAADFISVCGLRLVDVGAVINIAAEDAILLNDDVTGEVFFNGRVIDIHYTLFGACTSRYIDLKCQDLSYQLNETVIDQVEAFPADHLGVTADADIIDNLFTAYLPAVDSVAHVATLQDPLTITFNPCTLRSMLSQICTRTGGYFYIDFDNELHYFDAEAVGIGWFLSDTPAPPASYSYLLRDLNMATTATTVLDGIFVIGSEVSGWRGIHAPGDRQGIARDNRITTAQGIIDRGDAVLGKYGAAQVVYTVATYQAGLRAGYDVRFVSAIYGVDDTLTVRIMVVKWDTCGIPYYTLTLGAVVNPSLISERSWIDGLTDSLTITAPMLPTSSRGWSQNLVFSATDHNTVAWAAAGTIILADGTVYTINAGNTGDMAAITYIYLDLDVSAVVLQTTDNAASAVGSRILLVAWAAPVAVGLEAIFLAFGGSAQGVLVDTANIADDAVSAVKAGNALQDWSHTLVFSSTDHNTVAWTAGVIELADGTTYNIGGANTGDIAAVTYIFLDTDVSLVALQLTGVAANAVGNNRILVAVAQNVAVGKAAIFQTFGGSGLGVMITADQIVANTITANEILGNTITAAEIAAGTITTNEIAALTILAANIAAGTITTNEIAALTILAANIAAGTITTNEIAANTILAGNIAAGAIETDELNALAVTAAKIAANTITADKISMGIGDGLFNLADGLLLLGPHCEISTTAWTSLRKQTAVISGAFHQEAGRWLGTRGLVVEEATTNLITNPSIEVDTTGWSISNSAISRDIVYSMFGAASLKVVTNDAGVGEGVKGNVTATTAINTEYTFSVYLRGSGTVRLSLFDGGAGIQYGSVITLTGSWARYTLTKTFGAGAARQVAVDTDVQQDITFYCDGFQLEQQGYATSYADGTLGTGYAWTGAAHGSTSTRTATEVNLDAHAGLISSNPTLSFRLVMQMPYDADAVWSGHYLLDAWSVADRIFIGYRTDTDKFYVQLSGATWLQSGAQTFDAGDWIDLVLTLDFATPSCNLYVDGELVAANAAAVAAQVATQWNIGSSVGVAFHSGTTFAEFAVFDRVLTAVEVAGMYALTRPMIDLGSLDKPGIYILDGRFRIASSMTGNRIDITADEIAGYDSAGALQFELRSSDGKAIAGAGAVRMDADGLYTVGDGIGGNEQIRFLYDDAGTLVLMGNTYGGWGGAGAVYSWLTADCSAGDPWAAAGSIVVIAAIDSVAATDIRITVNSDGTVSIGGDVLHSAGDIYVDSGVIIFQPVTGLNEIQIPNNVADALHIVDAGALEWLRIITTGGVDSFIIDPAGAGIKAYIGMMNTPNAIFGVGLPTENFELIDAGSVGATQQDWVEVEIGGVQGYLRVFAAK